MSAGNRFTQMLIDSYLEEDNLQQAVDKFEEQLEENKEALTPYREPGLTPFKPKRCGPEWTEEAITVSGGTLVRRTLSGKRCKTPGAFARIFRVVAHGDTFICSACGARYTWNSNDTKWDYHE